MPLAYAKARATNSIANRAPDSVPPQYSEHERALHVHKILTAATLSLATLGFIMISMPAGQALG